MIQLSETNPDVLSVQRKLAAAGIYAMYGGRKGHGFWMYYIGKEIAERLVESFDPSVDMSGKCITNDGEESGNPCFWMFDSAKAFSEMKEI